jgi:N-acetylmuramoyl-L-alanine amidase
MRLTVTKNTSVKLASIGLGLASTATVMMTGVNVASASTSTTSSTTANHPSTYVVRSGDTFWKISRAFGINLGALEAANPTVAPLDMLIGSTLNMPSTPVKVEAQTSVRPSASVYASAETTPAAAPANDVNPDDLYWMEHVIHAEADGEPLDAQIAVGDVIMHRIQANGYGKTVKDVVFQVTNGAYQFSCVPNGFIYQAPSATNDTAALDVLQNKTDVVPGALVFYSPAKTAASSWVRQQPILSTIGDFVFAK